MSKEALSNFIKDLDSLSEQNKTNIFVPSLKKKVDFSLFNVQQHKDILKTAFEGFTGVVKSNNIYNDIILNNSSDDEVFSLADRSYVLLELRKSSLSDTYVVDQETLNLSSLPDPDFKFKYTDKLEFSGISIDIAIPDLVRDTAINKKLIQDLSKLKDVKQDKEVLSLAVTHEIVKFIRSIKLGDNTFIFDNYK